METQSGYSTKDLFWILYQSMILLYRTQITVIESDLNGEKKDVETRTSLSNYIIRAVGDYLIERCGETEESIAKALTETGLQFPEIAYPKEDIGVGIYSNIH